MTARPEGWVAGIADRILISRQSIILILAVSANLFVGCSNTSPEQIALASRLDAAITELKSIPTPTSPWPASSTTAANIPDYMEVRRALRRGDIAPLRAYLPDAIRKFEAGELSEPAFEVGLLPLWATLPEAIPALDAWLVESPRERAALLARGIVRVRLAWDERGSDGYRHTPKENLRRMRELCMLAADDLIASIQLSRRPIPAVRQLIEIAQLTGWMRKRAKALFAEGARIAPTSSELHLQFVPLLYGEWGGGPISEVEEFVAQAKRNGVGRNAWAMVERGLYNAGHGNIFDRDSNVSLNYLIEFSEKYDTYGLWFWRSKEERMQGRLAEAAKSLERATQLSTDQREVTEERGYQHELRGMLPEAVAEYERATNLESAWAFEKLIYAYKHGTTLGLQKDLRKARVLCEESAAIHQAIGEFCLSLFYHNGGAGLPQDDGRAAHWEGLAAHHGSVVAAQNRGWRLVIGKGLPANREEGIFWLRKAARSKDKHAIELLRQLGEPIEDPAANPSLYARVEWWINRVMKN